MAKEKEVGLISDYFAKVGVAGVNVTGKISVGDRIHVKGHTTDLAQVVESIQVDHEAVKAAKRGDKVGVKVDARCRRGDHVYIVKE